MPQTQARHTSALTSASSSSSLLCRHPRPALLLVAVCLLFLSPACCLLVSASRPSSPHRVPIKINQQAPPLAASYAATTPTYALSSNSPHAVSPRLAGLEYWSTLSPEVDWPAPTPRYYTPPAPAKFSLPPSPRSMRSHMRTDSSISGDDSAEVVHPPTASDVEAAWQQMGTTCVEHTVHKYVYRMCPFRNVTQRVGREGPEFVLGVWHGWHSGPQGGLTMRYTGGAPCNDGVQRQVQIRLVCSRRTASEKTASTNSNSSSSVGDFTISRVVEGRRCSYSARMYTPLVCDGSTSSSSERDEQQQQEALTEQQTQQTSDSRNLTVRSSSPSAASPASAALSVALSHQRRSGSLSHRIAFHAQVAAMQRCIRAQWDALTADDEEEEAAGNSSTLSAPLAKIQSKQAQQTLDSACRRFRPVVPPIVEASAVVAVS